MTNDNNNSVSKKWSLKKKILVAVGAIAFILAIDHFSTNIVSGGSDEAPATDSIPTVSADTAVAVSAPAVVAVDTAKNDTAK